jgi:hypothetical protein
MNTRTGLEINSTNHPAPFILLFKVRYIRLDRGLGLKPYTRIRYNLEMLTGTLFVKQYHHPLIVAIFHFVCPRCNP